ncbi:la-related protein 6-like [Amblyomma americanum]
MSGEARSDKSSASGAAEGAPMADWSTAWQARVNRSLRWDDEECAQLQDYGYFSCYNGPPKEEEEIEYRIVTQLKSYFSDEGLHRNKFLLNQVRRNRGGFVRRNRGGFVSVKLMASYRKLKNLTKDWEVVQNAILWSSQLELNAKRTKVRRRLPLP